MKADLLSKAANRAKNKKNGVYSVDGVKYGVVNGRAIFFIEGNIIYQRVGNFVTAITGRYGFLSHALAGLKEIVKDRTK